MKFKKFAGVLLTCLGCIAAFVGLAATVLPMIQNDQLHLVLSSFEMPSGNLIVSAMNSAMTYALHNCYLVMLAGACGAIVGALLLLSIQSAPSPQPKAQRRADRLPPQSPARPAAAVPVWHSSKAADAASRNPFANPGVGGIPAPAVPGGRPGVPSSGTGYAPILPSKASSAASAPAAVPPTVSGRSPYERPPEESAAAAKAALFSGTAPGSSRPASSFDAPAATVPTVAASAAAFSAPSAVSCAFSAVSAGSGAAAPEASGKVDIRWPHSPEAVSRSDSLLDTPAAPSGQDLLGVQPTTAAAQTAPVAPAAAAPVAQAPAAPVAPAATALREAVPASAAPVFSAVAPSPAPVPPAPAPESAPKPKAVKIKSTMGKHTL